MNRSQERPMGGALVKVSLSQNGLDAFSPKGDSTECKCIEKRFEQILEALPQPLFVLNSELRVVSANRAGLHTFGSKAAAIFGKIFPGLEYAEARLNLRSRLGLVLSRGTKIRNLHFDCELPQLGSRSFVLNAASFPWKKAVERRIVVSLEDVTKIKVIDQEQEQLIQRLKEFVEQQEQQILQRTGELENAHLRLQQLSARIIEAQETERRKIARDLHDEVGQQITCLEILLENKLQKVPGEFHPALDEVKQSVVDLLQTVRLLSSDLRPPVLDDFGLKSALENRFKTFQNSTGIEVRFNHREFSEDMLSASLQNVAFRVIQESLTNVARHTQAKLVSVQIKTLDGICLICISDTGCGFDSQQARRKTSSGLAMMSERVSLASGTLIVESAPGQGTRIVVALPLGPRTKFLEKRPSMISKPPGNRYRP